jgi:hypothetical protein
MNQDIMIWISGPWTGRTSDQGIFNQLLKDVIKDELVVSDSGYKGKNFVAPLSKKNIETSEDKYYNWECHAISARIENVNSRFKQFGCLKQTWRHDIQNHKVAFYVIANIIQIKLYLQPLRKNIK